MRPPHEMICRDPLTALIIGAGAVSAFGSLQAGRAQQDALEDQADQQREQARLGAIESEEEAVRQEEQRDRFLATQRVAFAANGIRVTPGAGSVMAVLDDTTRQFNKEIEAVRRRGVAQTEFGFKEAEISENKGRAALLSGFTRAVGIAGNTAYSAGVFNSRTTTPTKTTTTKKTPAPKALPPPAPIGPRRKDGTF